MAKPENIQDNESLVGGFSFGAAKRAAEEATATKPAPVTPAAPAAPVSQMSETLAKSYRETIEEDEKRTVRCNILIKPSMAKLLDDAVKRKEIKSKNDLVNYLLEKFFDE